MKESEFFESQTPSSRIKAQIVSEYFPQYARIITKKNKPEAIRYVDLFAGPGIYNDGNYSTPILIAKQIEKDASLRQIVHMIFNDNQYSPELKKNFAEKFPENTFVYEPRFGTLTVGESPEITTFLRQSTHQKNKNIFPSLLFIDPFGYKGIETIVLADFLKNWGNEIFLFVNTKRIHPALVNEKFGPLMKDLFPLSFEKLKNDRRYTSSVNERLNLIIEFLGNEYKTLVGGKLYYTAFRFQEEDSDATSHYILHLTKHARGFDLIKTIYNDFANVGTIFDGKNTYTFDAKMIEAQSNQLFDLDDMNIEKLKEEIYSNFRGKTTSAFDLFEQYHTQGLYSRSHFTKALRKLVSENKIVSKFTDSKNHEVTVLLIKECILKFN